jgi:hypothetical protein
MMHRRSAGRCFHLPAARQRMGSNFVLCSEVTGQTPDFLTVTLVIKNEIPIASGKPWFFFSCFKCFFYLPQVKKAHSVKSTEYFSQDIPFTFQYFLVLFYYFFRKHPKKLYFFGAFLYFFVLFEQIYFKKVKYFF